MRSCGIQPQNATTSGSNPPILQMVAADSVGFCLSPKFRMAKYRDFRGSLDCVSYLGSFSLLETRSAHTTQPQGNQDEGTRFGGCRNDEENAEGGSRAAEQRGEGRVITIRLPIRTFIDLFNMEWKKLETLAQSDTDPSRIAFHSYLAQDTARRDFLLAFKNHHKNIVNNLTTKHHVSYCDVLKRLRELDDGSERKEIHSPLVIPDPRDFGSLAIPDPNF